MDEISRKSVLQYLRENLSAAHRTTFLQRIIVVGRHEIEPNDLVDAHTKIIDSLTADYVDEPITGLLLVYKNTFFHIVEITENTFVKLIKQIRQINGISMKILPPMHHISERCIPSKWIGKTSQSPLLLEHDLPKSWEFETEGATLSSFQNKVYKLCQHLHGFEDKHPALLASEVDHLFERVPGLLPEAVIIEYIMNGRYVGGFDLIEKFSFDSLVCGVGVDVAYHQHVMGFYVTAASVVIFFMEITWVVSLFIQVCIRNDDSLCWGCWSGVLAITGGWRRAIFYLPLSCILAWKPHRLWLSFVAGTLPFLNYKIPIVIGLVLAALLAVLSLLHILSSALSRRGSQLSGGADCVGESLLNTRPESYDRFEDVLVTEVLDDGVPGSTNRMVESDGEM